MSWLSYCLEEKCWLYEWQTFAGALLGAAAPIAVLITERYLNTRKARKDAVELLLFELNEQLIQTTEINNILEDFFYTVQRLIERIDVNNTETYSVQKAYFPAFSVKTLSDSVAGFLYQSAYVSFKVRKVHSISHEMRYMVDSLKTQFDDTITGNRELALSKVNSAQRQKEEYKQNLKAYSQVLREKVIDGNLKTYINLLCELVAITEELHKTSRIAWLFKFDHFYHFYTTSKKYKNAKNNTYKNMDKYFQPKLETVKSRLEAFRLEFEAGQQNK